MHQPELAQRLAEVRQRISQAALEAGREADAVRLVAVTKTVPVERIALAERLGVRLVGENRVQEALDKQEALRDLPLTWHLIGHLQTNKVKRAVGRFSLIHSVDSLRLLEAVDQEARSQGIVQDVLLQVNVAREVSKFGFDPTEVGEALDRAIGLPGVRVRGLMSVAPYAEDPETVRWVFRDLARLRGEHQERLKGRVDLAELSMGMSPDFEVAIAEGATLVRIGTGIFGERPGKGQGTILGG